MGTAQIKNVLMHTNLCARKTKTFIKLQGKCCQEKMPEKIEIGYKLPFVSVEDSIELGARAEKYGYDSVWGADHVASAWGRSVEEQFTLITAIALKTKKVDLGMGVTDCHRRPPVVLAQTVSTIDVLSKGRFILGLGAGEALSLTPFGIDWEKPVSKLHEFIEVMKRLWTGEYVDYDGKFFKYQQARLANKPVQQPHPPIWVGGVKPRMLKITAKLGDGWLPTIGGLTLGSTLTPELYKKSLEQIWKLAAEVGRSKDDIFPGFWTNIGVAKDFDTALDKFEMHIKTGIVWERDLRTFTSTQKNREKLLEKAEKISVANLDAHVIGSPIDCINKIEKYLKAGVRHIVLSPYPLTIKDENEQQKTIAEKILPYFKEK